jgi:NifU-like protein involved in Fe-S cluster formation
MPCSDSSSGLNIRLTNDEVFVSFQFAKITCSSEISGETGLSAYCTGKSLDEILDFEFSMLVAVLNLSADEEKQFIMYLELDALKAGIAQYLGIEHPNVDINRCKISAIEHSGDYIDIAEVILPPQELPKIIACSKADE